MQLAGLAGAPAASDRYGTVSQSVLIGCKSERCAFYCYRETAAIVGEGKAHAPWTIRTVATEHSG